jgi:hypothetical protein
VQHIHRFVVQHAGAGGEGSWLDTRDFGIEVSTDGSSWTSAVSVTGNTADTTTHPVDVYARYVRLVVTDAGGDGVARIYEVEAYR